MEQKREDLKKKVNIHVSAKNTNVKQSYSMYCNFFEHVVYMYMYVSILYITCLCCLQTDIAINRYTYLISRTFTQCVHLIMFDLKLVPTIKHSKSCWKVICKHVCLRHLIPQVSGLTLDISVSEQKLCNFKTTQINIWPCKFDQNATFYKKN